MFGLWAGATGAERDPLEELSLLGLVVDSSLARFLPMSCTSCIYSHSVVWGTRSPFHSLSESDGNSQ